MPRPLPLTEIRPAIRHALRRYRRPIAASLAALGVVIALTTMRGAESSAVDSGQSADPSALSLRTGEVAVPVLLSSGAIAQALHIGDVIDVVGISGQDTAVATIVAPQATVLELPSNGSALSGSSSAVVVVAVSEDDALELSAASANGGVSVLIRSQ